MSTTTAWSANRYAANINCNLVPGVILKGASLAPKPGVSFRDLFLEWDWAGWLKPQIDCLHSIGGNTVRIIGDLQGVNDGTFTQSYYDARWAELITYAASKGMYVYPAGGGVSQVGTLTVTQIANSVAAAAAAWNSYSNVIGIDILQESVRSQASGSYPLSFPSQLTAPIKAVTSKPLTFSYAGDEGFGTPRWTFPLWRNILRPYVDFWDIHTYHQHAPAMLHQAFWAQGEIKPILIGEYGMDRTHSTADQNARYDTVVRTSRERYRGLHPAGVLQWAVFPQGTGANDFGMFEADGTPRTNLTSRFQQLPTT